jgi:hypothetical protein
MFHAQRLPVAVSNIHSDCFFQPGACRTRRPVRSDYCHCRACHRCSIRATNRTVCAVCEKWRTVGGTAALGTALRPSDQKVILKRYCYGYGAHEPNMQIERGRPATSGQHGLDRAAERGVEQRREPVSMRIRVPYFGVALQCLAGTELILTLTSGMTSVVKRDRRLRLVKAPQELPQRRDERVSCTGRLYADQQGIIPARKSRCDEDAVRTLARSA